MVNKRLCTGLLVLVLVGLAGCQMLPGANQANLTEQEIIRTYEITRGDLDITVAASGNTTANEQRDVYFNRDGDISAVHVQVNEVVQQGDSLAELDRTTLERQRRQSEINLEQAQINLERINNASAEERDIDFAQLNYDNAAQAVSVAHMGVQNAEIEANEMKVQAQRAREQAHFNWREAVANGSGNTDRLEDSYEMAPTPGGNHQTQRRSYDRPGAGELPERLCTTYAGRAFAGITRPRPR